MDRLVLLAVCLLTGCHGYLRVPDGWPLPARSVPTCGGGEIEARDGEVFFSPHTRDVGASLGVSFTEVGEGVTVSSRRRATSRLELGDRIVLVAAAIPPLPQKNEAGNQTLPGKESPPESLDALRKLGQAHPVKALSDLSGYSSGIGWLSLDLGLVRKGTELVLREKLEDEKHLIQVRRWDPKYVFRRNGIELCSLEDWPADELPLLARPSDHMVLRVEKDSPAGSAGLRPLDLISDVGRFERIGKARVRTAGGSKEVAVGKRRHVDLWVPFLFSWEDNGMRSHIGIGPLDFLFHQSTRLDYDAATDIYASTRRMSFLGTFQWKTDSRDGGRARWILLDPFFDFVRLHYLSDLLEKPLEMDPSASWGESVDLEDSLGAR